MTYIFSKWQFINNILFKTELGKINRKKSPLQYFLLQIVNKRHILMLKYY